MLRAMYSAISGLLNHQYSIDVIGNDISNVNTLAYKSKSVEFVTAYSQVSKTASDSNPVGISVGLGSSIQGVMTNFTQGTSERTNVTTDMRVSGEGFFVVSSSVNASGVSDGSITYTRAGDFVVDADGYLRTADGQYVMGYAAGTVDAAYAGTVGFTTTTQVAASVDTTGFTPSSSSLTAVRIPTSIDTNGDGTGDEGVASYSFGTDGSVVIVGDDGTASTIGFVGMVVFSNNNGLTELPDSYYQSSTASGTPTYSIAGTGAAGTIQSGVLELSNVDLSSEFADMILTQRGFDANAKTITTADEMLQTLINMKR